MSTFANHRRQSKRAFTLVELMVVVTMVGILSALAIMGISRYTGYVKNHEAVRVVSAIKIAQEAYRAAHGQYYNLSASLEPAACYPYAGTDKLGEELRSWAGATGSAKWDTLGVDVPGNVHFCYAVVAGLAGTAPTSPVYDGTYTMPEAEDVTGPWYVIQATGDPDSDGKLTVYVSTSFSEAVHHVQEDGYVR